MVDTLLSLTYATDKKPNDNPFKCTPEVAAERKARDFEAQCQLALVEWIRLIRNTTPKRHLATDAPARAPATPPEPFVEHVIAVGWAWDRAHGCRDGYALYLARGGYPHTFPEFEHRIIDALPVQLEDRKDARVKVNWTVVWSKADGIISIKEWDEMVSKTADPSVLDAAFPRDDNNQPVEDKPTRPEPPTYRGHTAVPDEAIHAIPNHIKRELELADREHGKAVRACFNGPVIDYVQKYGVEKAWDVTEAYVAQQKEHNAMSPGDAVEEARKIAPPVPPIIDTTKGTTDMPETPQEERSSAPETGIVAPSDKPAEPEKALTVVKPLQVEVIRDTAFTGRALLPSEAEWRTMGEVAMTGFKSGLLKDIKNEHAAKFIVETGRELGIPPSLALRKINLIHGQPSMAAELMWALVLDSGKLEDFEIVEAADHCTVTVHRKGAKKPYTTTFSLDMARKIVTSEYVNGDKKPIPLSDKYNWKSMPGVMCKWRALSAACRTIFPDVTLGLYSREEMEDAIDFTVDPDSLKQAVNA
jgi:hypothetical protein